MDLYISHSAAGEGGIKWFVVRGGTRPFDNTRLASVEDEVKALLDDGRAVYHIEAKPWLTKRLVRKRPIHLTPKLATRRRKAPS